MHAPVLVTPPNETPVSRDEAKMHLRVDGSDEDVLIDSLNLAATGHMDGYAGILGRALISQTWRQDFDAFDRCMRLPLLTTEIVSMTWRSSDGVEDAVDAENYQLLQDARGSFLRINDHYGPPGDLAEVSGVSITFVAGYGAKAAVPAPIKTAILLLVAHWFQNREAVGISLAALPLGVDALLAPYRRAGV